MQQRQSVSANPSVSPCPPRIVVGHSRHPWLGKMLSTDGVQVIWYEDAGPPAGLRLPKGLPRALVNVWRGTTLARRHKATLLVWSPREGFLSALLGALWRHGRVPILVLNLIAFPQSGLRGRIRDGLFRAAFARSRLMVTVNSEWLRQLYISRFEIQPQRIHVLYDCWLPKWLVEKGEPGRPDGAYVFAGGTAARDWATLLRAAASLPEIPFRIIARRRDWPAQSVVPDNVAVLFDTTEQYFWETAGEARIEVVCLSSPITSGLVVLILSSLMGRPVISTRTPATEAYYPENHRDLLVEMGDHLALARRIRALWADEQLRDDSAVAVQNHILSTHTPQAYCQRVREIVECGPGSSAGQ